MYIWYLACMRVCVRVLDPVQPELQIVSRHVGAWNSTYDLRKNSQHSSPLSHLSGPKYQLVLLRFNVEDVSPFEYRLCFKVYILLFNV